MLEFERKYLGKLRLLALIDGIALIEKLNPNEVEKYIVAYGFDLNSKEWRGGSYNTNLKGAMKEFMKGVKKWAE